MVKMLTSSWRWQTTALVLILTGGILLIYYQFDEPLRRHFNGAKPGVQIAGRSVEGMFRAEVAAVVAELAAAQGRCPVDAVLDEQREAIIPELNGIEVDREATVELVMKAPRDSIIMPVYGELPPQIRWEHYPSRPAYQGNPRKPAVALMINVTRGEEHLPAMLEVLEREGAAGTFFLTGQWAEKNEALLRRLNSGGHELGNHGYEDSELFTEMDSWGMFRSLRHTNEIIFDAIGSYPLYFTPQQNKFDDLVLEVVSRQGMRTVLWTLDTNDWQKQPGSKAMQDEIMELVAPGYIILMQPTEGTTALLEIVLSLLREKGLQVLTVAELLSATWFSGVETE